MSLGRMIRVDDLVDIRAPGPLNGRRGVVVRRTRFRSEAYVRVRFTGSSTHDGTPVKLRLVKKVTFEQLAAEQGVDPLDLEWKQIYVGNHPVVSCPLCERTLYFQKPGTICPRCNWRKPSLLERMASAAKC